MKKITLTIGIPAYNEERNIGSILDDIVNQVFPENIRLVKVLVVSDCSSDNTDKIVKEKSANLKCLTLHRNLERRGKMYGLYYFFENTETDVLILLDADVRLVDATTLSNLVSPFVSEDKVGMTGGNPIPGKSYLSFAGYASLFSYFLLQAIKKTQPNSVYSAHGRILAMSKSLSKAVKDRLIITPGDDQFLYLSCLREDEKFVYVHDAKVYYRKPVKINDYLNQNIRFRVAIQKKINEFGLSKVRKEFSVRKKAKIVLRTCIDHPLCGLCWVLLFTFGKILFLFGWQHKKFNSPIYKIAESTK